MLYKSSNDLIQGTSSEDIQTIHRVCNAEFALYNSGFNNYFGEILQNYKKMAGYLYSAADLAKIREEERPDFVYPLMLPIVLALAGNFLNNQNKVLVEPTNFGDFQLSKIMGDLIDYVHYTVNDLRWEYSIAYINSIIGRVGWIRQEWMYDKDKQGMLDISAWNPFGVMWDTGGMNQSSFKSTKMIFLNSWYTPEEIRTNFAHDNQDLWEEISAKVRLLIGEERKGKMVIPNYYERQFGKNWGYPGEDQGYDEISAYSNRMYSNANYWDSVNGLFKVTELHEKRQEWIMTYYDPKEDKRWDITEAVGFDKDTRKYDPFAMDKLRSHFSDGGAFDVQPEIESADRIYQVDVAPALNIKLMEEPYEIQNGNFKLTPIFCFNFGSDSMEWKSYVDHMTDPAKGYNLNMNTLKTILQKTANAEVWSEEDNIINEDEFKANVIGGLKYVKDLKKTERQEMPGLSPGLLQMLGVEKELIKEISGVRDNALGTRETQGESGALFKQRVIQTDQLQALPQTNAIKSLKPVGENTRDFLIRYLGYDRAFRITNDESDPYWLEINQGAIKKLFMDKETGDILNTKIIQGDIYAAKYDIKISDAPMGLGEQQRDFQEMIALVQIIIKLDPTLVDIELLIKNSSIKAKDTWLAFIKKRKAEVQQQQQGQQQAVAQEQQAQDTQNKLALMKQMQDMKDKALDIHDKQKEQAAEDLLARGTMNALAS